MRIKLVNHCEDAYIDRAYDYLLDMYAETDWWVIDFVTAYQERVEHDQRREEMHTLRAQVLEQINVLREAGRVQEADQIMKQLEQMTPLTQD